MVAVFAGLAAASGHADAQAPAPWLFFGGELANTRANISPSALATSPTQINPRTASRLALKWSFSTIGDVSATPTVEAGGLYVPDYAGWLYKLDPDTGAQIWAHQLIEYLGNNAYSRNSPAIGAMGEIVLGIQTSFAGEVNPGARVIAVDRTTGALRWRTTVDTTPYSYVTTSPVIYNKRVYLGVASSEEVLVGKTPGFKLAFRGSVVALDEATGAIAWKTYTVPEGYTGGSVWGSSPAVWRTGRALLVGTGNNISISDAATACLATPGLDNDAKLACLDPTDYVDSLLSLDLANGRLNWARRFDVDTWNSGCSSGTQPVCPTPAGLDIDFAQAPSVVYLNDFVGVADDRGGTSRSYLLGSGQKSGYYRGLNPYNGGLFWSTFLGRGEILWGSAINTDDRNAAYVAIYNNAHWLNVLAGQKGVPVSWAAGAWASVALSNGRVNWQVPTVGSDLVSPKFGGAAPGPVTFTNRVMFGGSTSGYFVGLDGNSGRTLWTFNAGGSVIGGPAVYNETLYWGAGSKRSGPGAVHMIYAFAVPPLTAGR